EEMAGDCAQGSADASMPPASGISEPRRSVDEQWSCTGGLELCRCAQGKQISRNVRSIRRARKNGCSPAWFAGVSEEVRHDSNTSLFLEIGSSRSHRPCEHAVISCTHSARSKQRHPG